MRLERTISSPLLVKKEFSLSVGSMATSLPVGEDGRDIKCSDRSPSGESTVTNQRERGKMKGWIDQSSNIDLLAKAWVKASGEMKDVLKTKTAETGKFSYSYADLAGVLAMARPILSANGLLVSQTAESDESMVVVWTTVMHESGQYVCLAPTRLPTGQTPQQTGSALSYARRYALMAALNLASEDDDAIGASQGKSGAYPTPKGRSPRRSAGNAQSGEARTAEEAEIRAILVAQGPDGAKEIRELFRANFGCSLSELPVEHHPEAKEFVLGLVAE